MLGLLTKIIFEESVADPTRLTSQVGRPSVLAFENDA